MDAAATPSRFYRRGSLIAAGCRSGPNERHQGTLQCHACTPASPFPGSVRLGVRQNQSLREGPKSRVAFSMCAGGIGTPREMLPPPDRREPGKAPGCVFGRGGPRRAGFSSACLLSAPMDPPPLTDARETLCKSIAAHAPAGAGRSAPAGVTAGGKRRRAGKPPVSARAGLGWAGSARCSDGKVDELLQHLHENLHL